MTKIVDAKRTEPCSRTLRAMPALALAAFLAACAQQEDRENADVMITLRKERCDIATFIDHRGDVKIIRNWIVLNETIKIPARRLSDYRNLLEQKRQVCKTG